MKKKRKRTLASSTRRSLRKCQRLVNEEKFTDIRKHNEKGSGRYYSPDLPKPAERQKQRRICFAADQEDIETVAAYYFGDRERLIVPKSESGAFRSRSNVQKRGNRERPQRSVSTSDEQIRRTAYCFLDLLDFVRVWNGPSKYLYASMGGRFLEDFKLVNDRLAIEHMISIEVDETTSERQAFNRPLGFIECRNQSSGDFIVEFNHIVADHRDGGSSSGSIMRLRISEAPTSFRSAGIRSETGIRRRR